MRACPGSAVSGPKKGTLPCTGGMSAPCERGVKPRPCAGIIGWAASSIGWARFQVGWEWPVGGGPAGRCLLLYSAPTSAGIRVTGSTGSGLARAATGPGAPTDPLGHWRLGLIRLRSHAAEPPAAGGPDWDRGPRAGCEKCVSRLTAPLPAAGPRGTCSHGPGARSAGQKSAFHHVARCCAILEHSC